MSVKSQRTGRSTASATPSSILKKAKNIKTRLSEIQPTPVRVKFQLPDSQKVQDILEDYVSNQKSREYQNILCLIRDADLTDEDVSSLLREATECITILNRDLRLFVEAILSLEWTSKNEVVVSEYQSFVINLLSAHNYHAKLVIDKLVQSFLADASKPEWPGGIPKEIDVQKSNNVHNLLKSILDIVPMCREVLVNSVSKQFPYYNKSIHIQEYYFYNVLQISRYQPIIRPVLLELLFAKLVVMDVNAPREELEKYSNGDGELFAMDDDVKSIKSTSTAFTKVNRNDLAHALDVCMKQMFDYILSEIRNLESTDIDLKRLKKLFDEILAVFEKVLLPTYDTHHVQYILFYTCSLNSAITEYFLNYLWKFSCNPSKASVLRQAAVNYLASFLARATFVTVRMLKQSLQNMVDWLHAYISTQDELGPVNTDVKVHRVFYSTCQALFYVIAFRHKDFVDSKRNITFLENLNMGRIVTNKLNPLRVCQPAVVQNFAAITRNYQLVYCYTIIEHNSRYKMPTIYQSELGTITTSDNILDAIFPFDPFVLVRSNEKIEPFYREYQDLIEEETMDVDSKETDVDDFLYSLDGPSSSNKNHNFSYSSSPGFKFKN